MPFLGGLILIAALACAIHAGKTRRPFFWIYIVLLVPLLGMFAYVLFELVPEWLGSHQGQQAAKRFRRLTDPEKDYRTLRDQAEIATTVETMTHLADECVRLGRFEEASTLYERCLVGMHANEPRLMLGLATALYGAGQPARARATLDGLRAANPEFQSAVGHLLYARTLEALGETVAAQSEYEALVGYDRGPESRCRYALLLQKTGNLVRARTLFADVKKQLDRAPRHVRKMHQEWHHLAARNTGA